MRGDAELVGREVAREGGADAEPEGVAGGEEDGGGAAERGDLGDHVVELEGRAKLDERGAAPSTSASGTASPSPAARGRSADCGSQSARWRAPGR